LRKENREIPVLPERISQACFCSIGIGGSIIGTLFDCRVESSASVGDFAAIRPSVAGWAQVTGHNTIIVDDRDPLAHGFQLQ
jgi:proline racemase